MPQVIHSASAMSSSAATSASRDATVKAWRGADSSRLSPPEPATTLGGLGRRPVERTEGSLAQPEDPRLGIQGDRGYGRSQAYPLGGRVTDRLYGSPARPWSKSSGTASSDPSNACFVLVCPVRRR